MPTVRAIATDAYQEIGVVSPGASLPPALGALALLRFQNLLDAWQADRLSMSKQERTTFTLPSGTSNITLGPSGADVTVSPTPLMLDTVNYIIPGSSPEIEVQIGQMPSDTYAALSIKELTSALPLQCFYQRDLTDSLATLFVWPQVTQDVDLVLYYPQGVGVPTSLNTVVTGPPGYVRAFMLDLAFDLCAPTGTAMPESLPLKLSAAKQTMQRPNVEPALLGVDPAVASGTGCGYNILSDVMQTSR